VVLVAEFLFCNLYTFGFVFLCTFVVHVNKIIVIIIIMSCMSKV